jgi:ketosteroid isomerase-like protein
MRDAWSNKGKIMTLSPTEVVAAILSNPTDIGHVSTLCAPDVVYVSLNYDDPELKRVMPWCGISHGPQAIVQTFFDVGRYWRVDAFEIEALFGSEDNVAVFGRFTYTSSVLGKTVTSPFACYAKVRDGLCRYLQFMEDSFATTNSFRSGGAWTIRSNPNGEEISV